MGGPLLLKNTNERRIINKKPIGQNATKEGGITAIEESGPGRTLKRSYCGYKQPKKMVDRVKLTTSKTTT